MADFRKFERMFKSVANRRRLAILSHLKKENEATVGGTAKAIHLSFKATSKHLALLYAAELVEREQHQLEMRYRIASAKNELIELLFRFL